MVVGSKHRASKERQCTPKGQAWYVNVQGSVHWECTGWGVDTGGAKFFNWLLKLTNQKRPKVTCLVRH